MYSRMLNKNELPSIEDIKNFVGLENYQRLSLIDKQLNSKYEITKELKFPFGNSYGWGFKYSHKTKHLFYLFFEKGALTATIQIGDKEADMVDERYALLNKKSQAIWDNRYPCGKKGGWIHYRILTDEDIKEVMKFIEIRKKPIKKVL